MTTSNLMPDVQVHIAFDSGYSTPAASRTWTDVSAYVELAAGISIGYGRADEFAVTDANSLTGLTLDNSDGRFTAGRAASPYYPNVRIGRPIRVTSTPVGGTPSVRFLGYVDEWPVAWDGTDNYAKAQISARSRLARLGFDTELGSIVTETFDSADPIVYFPMGEPEGSVCAVDRQGGPPLTIAATVPTDVNPNFGATTGLLGDPAGTGVSFPADGRPLTTPLASSLTPGGSVVIEAFITPGDTSIPVAIWLSGADGGGLNIETSGGSWAARYVSGIGNYTAVGADVVIGAPTHVAAELTYTTATDFDLRLYVDGVLSATDSGVRAKVALTNVQVGYWADLSTFSHVMLSTDVAGIPDRATAGLTGFADETASERIERIATFNGIDLSEVAADDGNPVAAIDTTGITAIDAMRKVETTENGVLFDARDNTLTFQGRAHRYNPVPTVTLDIDKHEVEADIAPKLDRTALVNDATVTASDGTTAHADDQTSIDDYGIVRQSYEIAASLVDATNAAEWRVNTYAEPQPRIPALGVNLLPLSQARQDDLFALEISDAITVDNFPLQAATTTDNFFIEGYTETIGLESYNLVFNVSPTTGFYVWTVQDATYGHIEQWPIAQ